MAPDSCLLDRACKPHRTERSVRTRAVLCRSRSRSWWKEPAWQQKKQEGAGADDSMQSSPQGSSWTRFACGEGVPTDIPQIRPGIKLHQAASSSGHCDETGSDPQVKLHAGTAQHRPSACLACLSIRGMGWTTERVQAGQTRRFEQSYLLRGREASLVRHQHRLAGNTANALDQTPLHFGRAGWNRQQITDTTDTTDEGPWQGEPLGSSSPPRPAGWPFRPAPGLPCAKSCAAKAFDFGPWTLDHAPRTTHHACLTWKP
ncbi:uncharacterized protein UV8b_05354 [Ustilaginoidea virens]|uniref:Uncharacterized protein n=1 Tax=Ustilaginoidea virens TaxID=1159556 RepID=A0A8E5MIU5_USTVR|nr:uncharacterized protein UV8b_05354 [Ustilaginoidea virens]QUC21111.1 hypothetical protein UV8b_05354 [Ustilaginoidea virens]